MSWHILQLIYDTYNLHLIKVFVLQAFWRRSSRLVQLCRMCLLFISYKFVKGFFAIFFYSRSLLLCATLACCCIYIAYSFRVLVQAAVTCHRGECHCFFACLGFECGPGQGYNPHFYLSSIWSSFQVTSWISFPSKPTCSETNWNARLLVGPGCPVTVMCGCQWVQTESMVQTESLLGG